MAIENVDTQQGKRNFRLEEQEYKIGRERNIGQAPAASYCHQATPSQN
jgi:hypothetical protein